MNIDKCMIAGRLTQPIRMRETAQGTPVCSIPLAVNRRVRRNDGTFLDRVIYFDIQAYANAALAVQDRLEVGDEVVIEGRHENREIRDTTTGKSMNLVDVVAEFIHFGKKGGQDG